jgi:hypothetical protein
MYDFRFVITDISDCIIEWLMMTYTSFQTLVYMKMNKSVLVPKIYMFTKPLG